MKILGIVAGLVVLGCGSDDGEARPTSCDPQNERVGTYLFHPEERAGGDCGPVEDSLVRFAQGSAPILGAGTGNCVLLAEPALSNGDCTLEQTVECSLPSGLVGTTNAITTQITESGSVLEGTLDFRGTDGAGNQVCHSVYDVTYTRQ